MVNDEELCYKIYRIYCQQVWCLDMNSSQVINQSEGNYVITVLALGLLAQPSPPESP